MSKYPQPTYIINIDINHNERGLHSIKGFVAQSKEEEYDSSAPIHLNSTVGWICWDAMIKSILEQCDNDVNIAIRVTQREFKLRQGKKIMYMRKYVDDEDVSDFIAKVDNFIKVSLLLGTC